MNSVKTQGGRLGPAFFLYNKILAWCYIILILVLVPLYLQNGYEDIAGGKFALYKWGSIIVLGLGIPGIAVRIFRGIFVDRDFKQSDVFVLTLGIVVCVSAACSAYPDTVMWGHFNWHMGLWTFMFMVGGWFLVTGYFEDISIKGVSLVWTLIVGAGFVVAFLAVLNRCGVDPLGFYIGMDKDSWEYLNLISTIGNTNWFAGFLSLGLGLTVAGYISGRRVLYALPVAVTSVAMIIQGSDVGLLTFAAVMLVALFFYIDENRTETWLEICIMVCGALTVFSIFKLPLKLPVDSVLRAIMLREKIFLLWLALVVVFAVCRLMAIQQGKTIMIILRVTALSIVLLSIILFVACNVSLNIWKALGSVSVLRFSDQWGSNRGILWKMTMYAYENSTILQKFVGVGPDCFSAYMYENYILNIQTTGQWAGSFYANAHNEWLNMLLTLGACGLVTYLGVLLSAAGEIRNRVGNRKIAIALCVVAYVVTGTFTFNHILSSPQLFVILSTVLAGNRVKAL